MTFAAGCRNMSLTRLKRMTEATASLGVCAHTPALRV